MNTNLLIENTNFIVLRDHHLTDEEQQILTHLYMPLIGSKSINIYITLGTLIKKGEIESKVNGHLKLFQLLQVNDENKFIKEKEKLEAVGLLTTLFDGVSYIYKLNHVLMANDFFANPLLSNFLYQKIGEGEYEQLMLEFLVHQFDQSKFKNISKAFDEVFEVSNDSTLSYTSGLTSLIVNDDNTKIQVKNEHFDYKLLCILVEALDIISKDILKSKEFYNLVNRNSFMYQLTTENVKDAIVESSTINKEVDYDTFIRACKKVYDKKEVKPKVVLQTPSTSNDKLVKLLEQTAPTEIVKNLFGVGLVSSEIEMFDTLIQRTGISLGVLNVLIIYVLQDKNGEVPSYNYFDKIIKTWQRMNITSTTLAMDYINGRISKPKQTRKTVKEVPDWYDEYIKEVENKEKQNKDSKVENKKMQELENLFKFNRGNDNGK